MGNGTSDSDGATVRQVRGVAAMVGGGAAISSSGSPVLPSFRVAGTNYTNVGAAVSALDVQTSSNAAAIANLANAPRLVLQDATSKVLTVGKDVAGTSVNLTGTAGTRTLTGVKAGTLAAGSTEAVNGAQLHATNQQVSTNTTNIANNTTNIATNSTNIQNNTTAINNIATGKTGLVQQDATSKVLTVGKDVAGTSVNLTGTAGTRTLTGVKAGTLSAASTEAVNGAQLHATNQQVSVNTTNIASNTTNIATNTTNIQTNTTAINNIATGRTGLVQQDPTSKVLTVGKDVAGTSVNLTGTAGTRTLTGVKAGTLAAGSTEAVNGAQLHATNQQVSTNTTNIANNTTNIQNNATAINNIATGKTGLVQQDATSKVLTVGKDVAGTSVNLTGTAGARTLTGVKAGALSAASTEAVNGAQLHATNQQVSTNTTNIQNNTTAINNIATGRTGLVQQDATSKVVTVGKDVAGTSVNLTGTAGARTLTGVKAGALSAASTEAVNGAQLHATNQQVSTNTTNIANNTTNIATNSTNIQNNTTAINNIATGKTGLVQQDATSKVLTVGKDVAGTSVNLTGTAGVRTLTGVKAGTLSAASTDAVNGAQLHATNQQVSVNTTNIANNATNIATNATNIANNTTNIANNTQDIGDINTALSNITNGATGLVQQDATSKLLTVGKDVDGASVNFTGTAGVRTLTGVKAGALSAGSTEAVNGAQLHATNQQVSVNTTNIANNTSDIGDINTAITRITNGAAGLVQQNATTRALTVGKTTDGTSVDFAGTAGARTLTGVKAGTLSAASTEAVNGAQLHATNQQVSTNSTNIQNNTTAINNIATGRAGLVQQDAASKVLTVGKDVNGTSVNFTGTAGARTLTGVKAGALSAASTEAVNGAQLHATNQQVSINTTNIENNTQDIGDINTALSNITNGATGLVQQDATSKVLTVGKDVDGASVNFTGTAGVRTLTGVKAGALSSASTEAVNGAQLHATNQQVSTNTTNIANNTTNIATNTTNIANNTTSIENNTTSIENNTQNIGDINTAITNITNGTTGLVQQDATSKGLTVGRDVAGTSVNFTGTAGARTLTGVKAGTLSAASTEAVNGAQLHATNQQVSTNTTNIANNTTNIATNTTNIENNTQDIGDINTAITNITNGAAGLVQQDATSRLLTVGKDVDGTSVDFTGTAGVRTLTGVKAGAVAAASTDAVNGAQLHTTNQRVSTNSTNIQNNTTNIATNTTNIANNTSDIDDLSTAITNITNGTTGLVQQDATSKALSVGKDVAGTSVDFTGTAGVRTLTGVKAGALSAGSTEAVNGAQLHATNQQVSVNTTNIENNTTDINEINTNITDVINGTTGLVQQDATTKALTVGKDVAGTSVNFAGTAGARQLDGVAAGTVSAGSLFAVNGGQFYGASLATANALGGGATVGANGAITAPTYNVGGTTVHSVGAAVTNLDGRLAGVEGSVTTVTNQINNGEIGLVKQDAATGNISMAADKGGKMVDISGKDGSRKMTGVADGAIAAGSSDAVNGGQIYALTERVGTISTATSYFAADGTGDGGDAARAAGGSQGVAAGSKANASGNGSVAIGRSAEAAGDKAVSMGAGATATASNSVAIGADAVADRADTVSVGAAGAERQIANVAAGTAATDAVNVSQMESHGKNTVARANAYTDARIDSNRREANAGVASAMAMAGLPQATAAGKSMVAMAGSTFNGESAMALGVSQVSKSGRWVYKAVASSNTRGNYGATLGAGFQW
ncbi:YadA family autotransporter adhesin [Cupriavidus campinensis]|uniref:YadA family autotransporter adhesin n=1 Tax=Cupriavidus campinensis TaxID=151783 RepID=UPI001FD289F5|nr:YadA family autotransporter adhesin [Cupriavidus campinensis]